MKRELERRLAKLEQVLGARKAGKRFDWAIVSQYRLPPEVYATHDQPPVPDGYWRVTYEGGFVDLPTEEEVNRWIEGNLVQGAFIVVLPGIRKLEEEDCR